MTFRILHLSDTHVGASGYDEDGVPAVRRLEQLLFDCRHLPSVDLIVVSGDIADDGSTAGCAQVRHHVGAFAATRGVPHVYTTGNHDRRAGFTDALGTGHLDFDGRDVGRPLHSGRVAAVSVVDGRRVISLDSLIEGSVHGGIGAGQLDALAAELRTPAPRGTVLAFHHPPIGAGTAPWTRDIGLRDADELAAVVAGSDVRAILCGHLHLQLTGSFAGATVWVTPGVVSRFDLTAPGDRLRAVHGGGASVVELTEDQPPTCYVLHGRDSAVGTEIAVVDPTTWTAVPETA